MRYPAAMHVTWQEWAALGVVLLFVASMLALMTWGVVTVVQIIIRALNG